MKQNLLFAAGIIFFTACNNPAQTTATKPDGNGANEFKTVVDTAKARQELVAMADDVHNLLKQKDISFIDKYMSKDGIYLGTDPNEVMTFSDFRDNIQKMVKDTATKFADYTISRREIKINGPSAVVIDQYMFSEISRKVMVRVIGYARYQDGKWMFDMYSWNVIPKNEDLPKINKAL